MILDLSIIIVNYNVRFFLEYCLLSVRNAAKEITVQIIVVDNASKDSDYNWLCHRFPEVTFIQNKENLGFGSANNVGISLAEGKYVLFLNPDTLVPDNALKDCLSFFENHADCGALGVHMMDGKGQFLPESKRSNPTPSVSFYKFSGLEKRFPTSRRFGQYALGFLDKNENHPVPILAGAFMMVRKSLLDQVGGFDEAFFMYGEDIDLSFRLQNNTGFKNYFLGKIKILHFKGESSKQDAVHYNKIFNEAMGVFVKKYYSNSKAFMMRTAIGMGTTVKNFALSTKVKVKKKEGIQSMYLMGDMCTLTALREKLHLTQPDIIIASEEKNARTIVLCIGKSFTYQDSLDLLSNRKWLQLVMWYDPTSNFLIGSNDKDETGIVLETN
ncbi:MAG: glycosyl transferase family 2 [Pseudopedobacter saltans]|uniref:Glycosyl transferase family 2 n=1 Tax=Pseudopedobacter saltans TaxID=151895 RepID=A0A2W5ET86_9SPHI|nr:MAG: glycosyl transferase family 2 [Pseudopedobacter saltans]